MPDRHIREVEDYTVPFLVAFCVLIFIGLFTLWAMFGYAVSLLSGYVMHRVIARLPRRS
ncbi:MAG: hypothetical protein AAGA12_01970 [Pseudomonadota bacterium]